jgi:hypothetical protein
MNKLITITLSAFLCNSSYSMSTSELLDRYKKQLAESDQASAQAVIDRAERKKAQAAEQAKREADKVIKDKQEQKAVLLWAEARADICPKAYANWDKYVGLSIDTYKTACVDEEAIAAKVAKEKSEKTFTRMLNQKLGGLFN